MVTKKRNTSKGLQALINGKYIVTDSFISAIVEAASIPDGDEDGYPSLLEEDFEGNWPNALDHLPPRGEEPSDRPGEAYSPDERRQEVFDGYTFVFYEKKQYDNLFPVITAGKGKALLKEVTPGVTDIDDFIRAIKGVAGEKGLGSFEDGSEGRGVVVVRYIPAKDANSEWFAQFLTSFAQRLDHRPIDQREFLEAILACDASRLRRPLEEESQSGSLAVRTQREAHQTESHMDIDRDQPQEQSSAGPVEKTEALTSRRGRPRKPIIGRFKGFSLDSDPEDETPAPEPEPTLPEARQDTGVADAAAPAASQDSLFVSQRPGISQDFEPEEERPPPRVTRAKQQKRPLSPLPEHDNSAFMDEIAPSATAAKRRRIKSGQGPMPPPAEPEPAAQEDEDMASDSPLPKKGAKSKAAKGKGKNVKEENDVLELARQRREEEEARLAAEKRALIQPDSDEIDYAAVRALHIVEECPVRLPSERQAARGREQDIMDGRWDPRWNGRKNFKRFRKQGEAAGRLPARIIIGLEEVKPKEYGIGDDYWLENDKSTQRRQSQSQTQTTQGKSKEVEANPATAGRVPPRRTVLAIDSSDEEVEVEEESEVIRPEPARSRTAKLAEKEATRRAQSQSQSQSQAASSASRASKRAAAPAPANERTTKRLRRGFQSKDNGASDDSEDDLKFRFGRRRG